jgi:hypothetical protein
LSLGDLVALVVGIVILVVVGIPLLSFAVTRGGDGRGVAGRHHRRHHRLPHRHPVVDLVQAQERALAGGLKEE